MKPLSWPAIALLSLAAAGCYRNFGSGADLQKLVEFDDRAALGRDFFEDVNLSRPRSISCASCHNPDHAFIDDRSNAVESAVSRGGDDLSLGDRDTPTITYAVFTPDFAYGQEAIGGLFADGRASSLEEQAKGPFLNSIEMQMPDPASVIDRILENPDYVERMRDLYGAQIFDDKNAAYNAVADAISSFERTTTFASFDSKFDRVQSGHAKFTAQERDGERLFRTKGCVRCHHIGGDLSLFTNYKYENIGVPINSQVRLANGKGLEFVDHGLLSNPAVNDSSQDGRFRVPTLRNVAVTAPYMHNGVFRDLKTVVHFYNTRDIVGAKNPETGQKWQPSEVTVNRVGGRRIGTLHASNREEDAIVAFLRTLTDARYEHLSSPPR